MYVVDIMMVKIENNKKIWFILAILSLFASITGIIFKQIYDPVVSSDIMPGILAQDIMTLLASVLLLIIALKIKEHDSAKQLVAIGIVGYLFYAYGIFVIEQLYTPLYLVYMAIFGLALYATIYSILHIDHNKILVENVSRLVRRASIIFLVITPLIFYPLWISQLVPLIQNSDKIEFLYSIYILDICFIMPAFIIIAYKLLKTDTIGTALSCSLYILGFTLLFPLSIAEILKPIIFDQTTDAAGMGLFLFLSLVYIVLAILNLRRIKGVAE